MNWIIMLVASGMVFAITAEWDKVGIRKDHKTYARLVCLVCMAFVLAHFPGLIMRILGATSIDARRYFALWGYIWYCMIVFSLILATLLTTLGPGRGMALHSVFLVVNFISSPIMSPAELAYPPFRLGLGLPVQNGIEGSRTVLFDSYNQLPRCLGVLAVWMAACLLILAYTAHLDRRALQRKLASVTSQRPVTVALLP